jgi:arylsulfatase A-like enzyme
MVDETHWARFFAAAIGELAVAPEPFCLWLHTGSLGQLWDAPLELRDQYRDEDDPRSADSAEVPDRRLPDNFDPDELLAIVHAYAGQISLLDLCLGGLLDGLAGLPGAANTLLAVLSPRGFPLGEHNRVGACDDALYAELIHIPLLLRLPDGRGASDRSQALVQPPDLHATLLDWCRLQPVAGSSSPACGKSLLPIIEGRAESVRDRACAIASPEERAIVTLAWSMRLGAGASSGNRGTRNRATGDRRPAEATEAAVELFTKPDDWFEVNEVSDRCGEVATEMEQAFLQFEQASQSTDPADVPPLPAALVSGVD